MTLQQLDYIVAVFKEQSFSKAAQKCFVTQPTLSMQIQKLEEEMGIFIFDRSKHPIVPTAFGNVVVEQAITVLKEAKRLKELVDNTKDQVAGDLRIGVIPTIAPYLIPLFLSQFLNKYPDINLILSELPTEQILFQLKNDLLDAGILVTPLSDPQIKELPLYYEPFVAYVSPLSAVFKKETLSPKEMDLNEIWLLNEGHCMQSQVINLCYERKKQHIVPNFEYRAGSIETLRKMVELNNGATLLPALAIDGLSKKQMEMVRYFKSPTPVREVSLATHRDFVKKNLIDAIANAIKSSIPLDMRNKEGKSLVEVQI